MSTYKNHHYWTAEIEVGVYKQSAEAFHLSVSIELLELGHNTNQFAAEHWIKSCLNYLQPDYSGYGMGARDLTWVFPSYHKARRASIKIKSALERIKLDPSAYAKAETLNEIV